MTGGLLSVVATPIGHLDDLGLRALATLRAADTILAEDTRRTKTLLAHHGISTKLRSFHAHTSEASLARVVEELRNGAHLALVTDAGTPVVSDPGVELVAAARDARVRVETIPGPSAITAAVAVAGLRADSFRFVGFLPRKGARRRRTLEAIARDPSATVLFESPQRLAATLSELAEATGGERRAAICRELTKKFEEVRRGTLRELAASTGEDVRGEVTIVVEAIGDVADEPVEEASDSSLDARARELLGSGMSPSEAAKALAAEARIPRRRAYEIVLAAR